MRIRTTNSTDRSSISQEQEVPFHVPATKEYRGLEYELAQCFVICDRVA